MENPQAHRIEQLEKYHKEDPSDPFPKYALALEYQQFKQDIAESLFDELLADHPEYSPTYYHAADFFYRMNKIEKARSIYERGIKWLKKAGEQKALNELQNAYQNFQFEVDY